VEWWSVSCEVAVFSMVSVEVFWELGAHALGFEDSENLVTSDVLGLGDSILVSDLDTDGGWSVTLLGELDDGIHNIVLAHSKPSWCLSDVGQSRAAHTLTWCVHSSHGCFLCVFFCF